MLCGDCLMHCNSLPALFCICICIFICICFCICIYGALACLGIFGALQLDAGLEPGWIFFDQLTFRFSLFPALCQIAQFSAVSRRKSARRRFEPTDFPRLCLVCICGKARRRVSNMIFSIHCIQILLWYSAYSRQRNGLCLKLGL